MTGYAPNPTSTSSENGYAPLTAGLLARKGEAMPAVDADAHAGVDIDMRPVAPASGPQKDLSQRTIESLYPANSSAGPGGGETEPQAQTTVHRPPPEVWTAPSPRRARSLQRERRAHAARASGSQRKATVTFRMPASDFVRMRFASRDMEMSCQAIILEALDCYLDANDIALVPEEVCESEVDRLMRAGKKKPQARKVASLAE